MSVRDRLQHLLVEPLGPQQRAGLGRYRQIQEPQNPFVRPPKRGEIPISQQARRPVHLVGDHEDLLIQGEAGPPLGRQRGVLCHSRGSPRPISAKVISRTRARTPSSSMTMLRFPRAGRMLISEDS